MLVQQACLRAELVSIDDEQILVCIDGEEYQAEWAMAAPVQLQPGDAVLCAGDQDGRYYLVAPIGQREHWQVRADRINLEARELRLGADRLEFNARRLFEKCVDAYRWTSELLQWCCGRQRMLIDGQQQIRAERIDQRAKRDVRIDGEHINLG